MSLPTDMLGASYSTNVVGLNSLIAHTPHWSFVPLDRHETWKHPSTVHGAASEQRYANLNRAVRVHDE